MRQVSSCDLDEACLNIRQRICAVAGRHNSARSEVVLSGKLLVEVDNFVEELDELELWGIVGVAGRAEGSHAGAVLAPFVLPELFVRAVRGGNDRVVL